jgi:hypothetical protein
MRKNMEGKPNARRRLNFDDVENTEAAGTAPSEGPPAVGNEYLHGIEEEVRRDLEAATLRWNFDFENEVPLEGRWQWEQVEPSEPPRAKKQPVTENQDEDRPEK